MPQCNFKTGSALNHHRKKEVLLFCGVVGPDQRGEQLPREVSALTANDGQRGRPVQDGVDPIECPCLVEDDLIAENSSAPEHLSGPVKVLDRSIRQRSAAGIPANFEVLVPRNRLLSVVADLAQALGDRHPTARQTNRFVAFLQEPARGP